MKKKVLRENIMGSITFTYRYEVSKRSECTDILDWEIREIFCLALKENVKLLE